jgi:hypothetical protein
MASPLSPRETSKPQVDMECADEGAPPEQAGGARYPNRNMRLALVGLAVLLGITAAVVFSLVRLPPTERTPPLVTAFVDATFVPPFTNDFQDSYENFEGDDYHIVANLTTIETGVGALAAAKSMLHSISCFEDGTVKIKFLDELPQAYIDKMFPNGTILAIDGSVIGSCFLGVDDGTDDLNSTKNFANETKDGYLFIETVSLSPDKREVIISGQRSSFFYMSDEADIMVKRVSTTRSAATSKLWHPSHSPNLYPSPCIGNVKL